MALIIADRIKETSTSTGTGAFILAGAVLGFKSFASRCTSPSDTCYYTIQGVDGSGNPTGEWETGKATYSAANTLTRTTVTASSNADAAVSFSAGTKQVWLDMTASQIASLAVLTAVQTWAAAQIGGVTPLTVASNLVAVNLAAANNFSLALQATTGQTLSNPTGAVAGQSGQIALLQNAAPSTLAFGSNWIPFDGATPTVSITASARNLISYYVVSATEIWFSLNKHGVA
ncbi:hypothetical protein [Herminiimonas sp. CN]|uniref:hypothetical protein n=1 Tax=Herminiimonas sp. CN TaxID=1349818 RepID=UPI0004737A75|nr:hypothetical protein [Herminiimonas sp. CN]